MTKQPKQVFPKKIYDFEYFLIYHICSYHMDKCGQLTTVSHLSFVMQKQSARQNTSLMFQGATLFSTSSKTFFF